MRGFLQDLAIALLERRHRPDFEAEIAYWERYLAESVADPFDPAVRRAAYPALLRSETAAFRAHHARPLRVLEVGPGPQSILLDGVLEGEIEVTAVDPLAERYADLLRRLRIDYPIRARPGFVEVLTRYVPAGAFDLVYSSNALDHAMSVPRGFREMVRAARPGGTLLLEGFVDEGTHGGWHGLHQHDLRIEDGRLTHRDRAGTVTDLAHGLDLRCVDVEVCRFGDRQILAYGYEVPADISPEHDWRRRDWYRIAFRKGA